jgi:surfeit locus 1 family protein
MHQKMPLTIKNWKLTLLALCFIGVFISLGMWQLSRAREKTALLAAYTARTQQAPLKSELLTQSGDWRFYRASLHGEYDNQHTILLDNKIQEGKIGYEVYTPFKADGVAQPILIDRGFISLGVSRRILPTVAPITGKVSIVGMLNLPPTYVAFGQIYESNQLVWPLRVEYIQFNELMHFVGALHTPYLLQLAQDNPGAYQVKWQIVTMSPEKHQGYAVQWFAFALTLLILSVALNRR